MTSPAAALAALIANPMTDEQLVEYLGIARCAPAEIEKIMASITPDQRALYEHMKQVETDLILWQSGVGPMPKGVIVCREHKRRSPR